MQQVGNGSIYSHWAGWPSSAGKFGPHLPSPLVPAKVWPTSSKRCNTSIFLCVFKSTSTAPDPHRGGWERERAKVNLLTDTLTTIWHFVSLRFDVISCSQSFSGFQQFSKNLSFLMNFSVFWWTSQFSCETLILKGRFLSVFLVELSVFNFKTLSVQA